MRKGLTLIELLVVMAIVVALLAITAIFLPRFGERQQVDTGASSLQGWLLLAKQQAKRDNTPTGARLTGISGKVATGVQYIQQPDDVAIGLYAGPGANAHQAQISTTTDLTAAPFSVGVGDYLEVYGGGVLRQIVAPPPSFAGGIVTLNLNASGAPLPAAGAPATTGAPVNYRIIRQAAPLANAEAMTFPANVGIDLNPSAFNNNQPLTNLAPTAGNYDIVFAPSGAVVQPVATGMIFFFVRNYTQPNNLDIQAGRATLIYVQARTGFIGAAPVSSTGSIYQFAQDGRATGM